MSNNQQKIITFCSYTEQLKLIEAIARGSITKVTRMMDKHLQSIQEKLVLEMRSPLADLEELFAGLTSTSEMPRTQAQ